MPTLKNITLYNERTGPELYYPEHCTLYRTMYRTRYRVQTIILVLFTEHSDRQWAVGSLQMSG